MADSNKDLKINIEVKADSSEAEEKSRLLEKSLEDLNKISPGLGNTMNLLALAYFKAGEAAKEGATGVGSFSKAFGGQIRSLGTFAIIDLGIQAAMTYWDLYQEKVAEAAEKQAKSLDKIRESTKAALDEKGEFDEAMKKASEPDDPEAQSLDDANTIISAQTDVKRKLMKSDLDSKLDGAKTPEERSVIEKNYEKDSDALSSDEESQRIEALGKVITGLQEDQTSAKAERKQMADWLPHIPELVKTARAWGEEEHAQELLDDIPRLNKKIAALDEKIEGDQKKITQYGHQKQIQGTVHKINDVGREQTDEQKILKGVESNDASAHGEKLSQEQIKTNQALTQLFAAHAGGIQQMQQIIKYHLEHSTTQAKEIAALKNALDGLQGQVAATSNRHTG
ncbi:MAG TPA: hypothetical protein VG347_11015 [Verrucomicrobiae bacterium]|nr:hypothetical protein [Verrucomicrobiae bacterium]